jgi:hypothetical protein
MEILSDARTIYNFLRQSRLEGWYWVIDHVTPITTLYIQIIWGLAWPLGSQKESHLSLIFFAKRGEPLSRKMDIRLYAASPAMEASFTAYGHAVDRFLFSSQSSTQRTRGIIVPEDLPMRSSELRYPSMLGGNV